MISPRYKFICAEKLVRSKGNKKTLLLSATHGGPQISITFWGYAVAKLFNGLRSKEEVMDVLYSNTGARITKSKMDQLIVRLIKHNLLQDVTVTENKSASSKQTPLESENESSLQPILNVINTPSPSQQYKQPLVQHEITQSPSFTASIDDEVRPSSTPKKRRTINVDSTELVELERPVLLPEQPSRVKDSNAGMVDNDQLELGVIDDSDEETARLKMAATRSAGSTGKRIFCLPHAKLLPLFSLFTLPLHNKVIMSLLMVGVIASLYGLSVNRVDVMHDLQRMFAPLTLFQMLLLSMFSVNLVGQLSRAVEVHRATRKPVVFGLTMALNLIPRFITDFSSVPLISSVQQRQRVLAATVISSLALFVIGVMGWFLSRGGGTFLPLLSLAIAAISAVTFLMQINPLARGDGYYLIANKLGVSNLREQAFFTLFAKNQQERTLRKEKKLSPVGLRIYGLAMLAYVILISTLIVIVLGGWLETHWGGLGVIIFLSIVLIALKNPIHQARARAIQISSAVTPHTPRFVTTPANRRRSRNRLIPLLKKVAIIGLFVGAGALPYTYEPAGEFELLPAERVDIRSLISGDIKEIYVTEGEYVEAGAILARLSADEEKKNVSVYQSKVAELKAKLAMAEQGATKEQIASAKQKVQTARSRSNFSEREAERLNKIYKRKLVSAQEYEDAQARAQVDRELLAQTERDLDLVIRSVRKEEIDIIKAEIEQQTAQLNYHLKQLDYTELTAAISGRIVSGSLLYAVGQYLDRGDIFAAVESTKTLLAEIELPQADINEVRIGAAVRIKTWAYPEKEFHGIVQSIAPNAQDSDYGKVIRVLTEIDNSANLLKPELTGYAKISGETRPAVLAFTKMLIRFFKIELWSWLP